MMPRVLIVGAGPTGAICANILRKEVQGRLQVEVWEKSRGTGGRMNTSRDPKNPQCTADLGAQYYAVRTQFAESHKSYYQELLENEIIRELTGKIEGLDSCLHPENTTNYVTPGGVSSTVKYFLSKSDAEIHFQQRLTSLSVVPKDSGNKLRGTSDNPENEGKGQTVHGTEYDAVILTMPVPQILQLGGLLKEKLDQNPSIKTYLEGVSYSSRYALGLFFPEGISIDVPWVGKYVMDNPCIRWVSIDNRKRGIDGGCTSIVVHTSVPFGIKHLETDKAEVQPIILQELKKILPTMPEPSSIKCQKWRYSQVHKSYEGSPGTLVLDEGPSYIVLAAGDGFTHSNLDGCIDSAQITCKKLIDHWKMTSQL